MVTQPQQAVRLGFPSIDGSVWGRTVDETVDIVKSQIPKYFELLKNRPDLADTYMSMSKEGKTAILKELEEQNINPKTPEEVREIAIRIISHAMSQGVLDAAIMLMLNKFPPVSDSNAKGGALDPSGVTVVERLDFNMKNDRRMFDNIFKLEDLSLDNSALKEFAGIKKNAINWNLKNAIERASQEPQWVPSAMEGIADSADGLGLFEAAVAYKDWTASSS